jgi:hypothetical protein
MPMYTIINTAPQYHPEKSMSGSNHHHLHHEDSSDHKNTNGSGHDDCHGNATAAATDDTATTMTIPLLLGPAITRNGDPPAEVRNGSHHSHSDHGNGTYGGITTETVTTTSTTCANSRAAAMEPFIVRSNRVRYTEDAILAQYT